MNDADSQSVAIRGMPFPHYFFDASSGAARVQYAAGAVVCQPDTPANNVIAIQQGQLRVSQVAANDSAHLLEILGPGDWFGAAALAGRPTCGTQVVATVASVVWEMPIEGLVERISQDPALARRIIVQLADKVFAAREDSAQLIFDDCTQRLLKTLLRFANSAAATSGPTGVVLRITHRQLAQAIGVARETVSLTLTQLRNQNLLRTGRKEVEFDPLAVERFMHERHASAWPRPGYTPARG